MNLWKGVFFISESEIRDVLRSIEGVLWMFWGNFQQVEKSGRQVEAGGKKVGGFKKFQKLSARTKMSKNIQILFQTIQTIIQKYLKMAQKNIQKIAINRFWIIAIYFWEAYLPKKYKIWEGGFKWK